MYKHYEKLDQAELDSLIELSNAVQYISSSDELVRVNENNPKVISRYRHSKWFDWKHKQRVQFEKMFPKDAVDVAVQGWFLNIAPDTGLLTEQKAWVNEPRAGHVIATALKDQSIYLDGNVVTVQKGEQIGFSLRTVHEIKKSKTGQLWACILFQPCYTKFSD